MPKIHITTYYITGLRNVVMAAEWRIDYSPGLGMSNHVLQVQKMYKHFHLKGECVISTKLADVSWKEKRIEFIIYSCSPLCEQNIYSLFFEMFLDL